jgi:hypothetical protein
MDVLEWFLTLASFIFPLSSLFLLEQDGFSLAFFFFQEDEEFA